MSTATTSPLISRVFTRSRLTGFQVRPGAQTGPSPDRDRGGLRLRAGRAGRRGENHWLTERQFLDAVAVGLITPGPVVITAVFIGYLVAGLPGAMVSALGIFTPIYLGVVIPGRWFISHREDRRVRAFVKGATAGAAGAIAGATLVLARGAIVDLPTVLIALGSLVYLWRLKFRLKEPALVLTTGAVGLLLHGI